VGVDVPVAGVALVPATGVGFDAAAAPAVEITGAVAALPAAAAPVSTLVLAPLSATAVVLGKLVGVRPPGGSRSGLMHEDTPRQSVTAHTHRLSTRATFLGSFGAILTRASFGYRGA
jgi:hypothetical protein